VKRAKGAYSWGGAASTGFCIDPEKELVTIFMIQILPDEGITFGEEFRRLVYDAVTD
jgi:CubicO group peptidase (beta-lactamase class C family)